MLRKLHLEATYEPSYMYRERVDVFVSHIFGGDLRVLKGLSTFDTLGRRGPLLISGTDSAHDSEHFEG